MRFLGLLLLAMPALAAAQIVADRTTLNSIIGASGVLVDFESYSIGSGGATSNSGVTLLNSSTTANGQGPNLVPAGVEFTFGSGNLQWDGDGYYSAPSREILSSLSNTLGITFTTAAKAFGLDLRSFAGYSETASISVYGSDQSTVLYSTTNLSLSSSGVPIFFGYQSSEGIGKVVFSQTPNNWSPIIDNLKFTVIPEPAPCVLLGGGLVLVAMTRRRLRRRERDGR